MRYYLDTEFDGYRGPLLSLALVREDGVSAYYVIADVEAEDPWVCTNVLPILWAHGEKPRYWTASAAAMDVAWFLRDDPEPVIVTDWPADIRYLCELIEFPAGEMAPIIPTLRFEMRRVDAYPTPLEGAIQHNAWWDAMALREKLNPSVQPDSEPADGEGTLAHTHVSKGDPPSLPAPPGGDGEGDQTRSRDLRATSGAPSGDPNSPAHARPPAKRTP